MKPVDYTPSLASVLLPLLAVILAIRGLFIIFGRDCSPEKLKKTIGIKNRNVALVLSIIVIALFGPGLVIVIFRTFLQ